MGDKQAPDYVLSNTGNREANFSGDIKIGYATTLGYNNLLGGHITIGKYCQVGVDVALHASNHPMNHMTTYINQNLFNGALKTLKQENKIVFLLLPLFYYQMIQE